jgi:hypothetical protein
VSVQWGLLSGLLVTTALAWAVDLKQGVEHLAAQLAKSAPEPRQLRVAVTDFPDLQSVGPNLRSPGFRYAKDVPGR